MSLLRRRGAVVNPEARLVAAASRGDTAAFDQLRAHHEPAVIEFCSRMLEERRAEAAGVTAETFAAGRRELSAKDPQVELRPWLYALAFERCVARLDDGRQGGAVLGQGEPHEQQRGAALMLGALPQAELVSLMGLAGSRPALFGLVSQLGRSAPGFLSALAVDQAAGQAVAALLPTIARTGGPEAAKHTAQMRPPMAASAQGMAKGADRFWNGARVAAATAGAVVVGTAGTFAVASSTGNGDRDAVVRKGAPGAATQGTPGSRMSISDAGRGSATSSRDRDGASARDARGTGGARDGRNGRDGRDGTPGSAGRAGGVGAGSAGLSGRDGAAGTSGSNANAGSGTAGPGTGTGGPGTGGPGGLTPRERSLLKLDLEVGSIEAHVRVP